MAKRVESPDILQKRISTLMKALKPFTQDDFTERFNGQNDNTVIYQRNDAALTVKDFKRAKKAYGRTKP